MLHSSVLLADSILCVFIRLFTCANSLSRFITNRHTQSATGTVESLASFHFHDIIHVLHDLNAIYSLNLAADKQLYALLLLAQGSRGPTVPPSRIRWPRNPTLAFKNRVPRGRIPPQDTEQRCYAWLKVVEKQPKEHRIVSDGPDGFIFKMST